jgi:Skp family chaperone for outer membrane proteins
MKMFKRLLPVFTLILLLAGGVALWANRDNVLDWWTLRGYDPPQHIAQLAEDTAMTGYAERLFYVNKPTLDDKETFNVNCAGILTEAAVLGCYKGDRRGIHIYDVTDERLHGIEEVTAAHEMLHQAYDRLSADERARIDGLLNDFYQNGLQNADVRNKISLYEEEHAPLANEMHSIFGSEVAELPGELEEYYARYFNDRAKVVSFHQQSRAAFNEYRNEIASYDQRLAALQTEISNNEAILEQRLRDINQRRAKLDAHLAADQIDAYNQGVPAFNSLVESYNNLLSRTQTLANDYNGLVAERNALAVQVTNLNAALDSRLTPQ